MKLTKENIETCLGKSLDAILVNFGCDGKIALGFFGFPQASDMILAGQVMIDQGMQMIRNEIQVVCDSPDQMPNFYKELSK